jgi:hypothetical protein
MAPRRSRSREAAADARSSHGAERLAGALKIAISCVLTCAVCILSGSRLDPECVCMCGLTDGERAKPIGVMPNPRQVQSEGQRSPSKISALCKGFERMMT